MSEVINDGGPAFPFVEPAGPGVSVATGMSLRDHFAGLVLQGICAHPDTWGLANTGLVAMQAYRIADDMLKARGGP